jgi:predicted amidohydrolase
MNVCAAQIKPISGDIQSNIVRHTNFINLASSNGAEIIIFPELSLTGYEPKLASKLAVQLHDNRLDIFQQTSDAQKITIGVGLPLHIKTGISIAMAVFQPAKARQVYCKEFIHADEEPFFKSAKSEVDLTAFKANIAFAICYEISVPKHAENAFKNGAGFYMASVAKFENAIDKAISRLSQVAAQYSMSVLMANSIGAADGQICAGKSSVWNNQGILKGQLNSLDEGLLFYDSATQQSGQITI